MLSLKEQKVLTLESYELSKDWRTLYITSRDKAPHEVLVLSTLPQAVSKWKNSKDVQTFLNEQIAKRQEERAQLTKQILDDFCATNKIDQNEIKRAERSNNGVRTVEEALSNSGQKYTNYKNKDAIVNELNDILNRTTNDSDKLAYIKTLIDLLQFKQESPKNDIQRFYTPLKCEGCPLHQLAAKEGEGAKSLTL